MKIKMPSPIKALAASIAVFLTAQNHLQAGNPLQSAGTPNGIATFESIGVRLPYSGDDNRNSKCAIQYRVAGSSAWKDGFTPWADRKGREFRGSLIHLTPDTAYQIRLTVTDPEGGNTSRDVTIRTWSENFKVAKVVILPESSSRPLVITQGGSASTGYVVYQPASGKSALIDVRNNYDHCVVAKANYVIIRGLTLKGARTHAVRLDDRSDVVVERCDISGWGKKGYGTWGENHAAIYANGSPVKRIIVQRNKIHHPRWDTNTWSEPRPDHGNDKHPVGPSGLDFQHCGGNHVIRFNHIYSDASHYFKDGFCGGPDSGTGGFPGSDSDIHGNIVENVWDDAIEAEGGNINVRIWGNFLNYNFTGIASRSTTVGPLYTFRNVFGNCESTTGRSGGFFRKAGFNSAPQIDYGVYDFHNTVLRNPGTAINGPMTHHMTRNNILYSNTSIGLSTRDGQSYAANDFDYDLIPVELEAPRGYNTEPHGIRAKPVYVSGYGFNRTTWKGIFQLVASSPGFDRGQVIPNFNDGFTGKAPDIGAHEAGFEPMEFGPSATRSFPRPLAGVPISSPTLSKPGAPSSLSASALSSSQIKITWMDNSSVESTQQIERSSDGINFQQVATVGANITSYTSSGLVAARKYYFKVRASNASGFSSYSNIASATTMAVLNKPPLVSISLPSTTGSLIAPASIVISASASDPDGAISKVEFFNGTMLLKSDVTTPYSVNWQNIPAGSHTLTARATDDKGATTTSAPITLHVEAAAPAPSLVVTLTKPLDGAIYETDQVIPLWAIVEDPAGIVARVEFHAGANLIGTDRIAPFGHSWPNAPVGSHTITAKAYDKDGKVYLSKAAVIQVVRPKLAYVADSTLGQAADSNMVSKLEGYGFEVTIHAAATVGPEHTAGCRLVVISSTTDSVAVGNRLKLIPEPIVCWEPYLFDDLGMTGAAENMDYGWKSNVSSLSIQSSTHPLAAGLSGQITLQSTATSLGWGKPATSALIIANLAGHSGNAGIFAYERGSMMTDTQAPGRRVGLSFNDASGAHLSSQGWALFEAAIRWASGRS
jgi:hypothetical protein